MRRFEDHNPITVAFYFLCVIGLTMFSMNPMILILSLCAGVLTLCLYTHPRASSYVFGAGLFVVLAIINPLVVHRGATVLFYLNSRPFTLEALLYGLTAAAMVVAALCWLRALSGFMTSDKVLYLFSRLSPKLALLLSMAIRYLKLFRQRWRKTQQAQKALGLYDDGNLIDAVRGRARVFSILMTWALENGVVTADSMDARGYGSRRRSSFALFRFHLSDGILILLFLSLTALTAAGLITAHIDYYPDLDLILFSPLSVAGYLSYGVLTLTPIILNTKEAIRWHSLRSGI